VPLLCFLSKIRMGVMSDTYICRSKAPKPKQTHCKYRKYWKYLGLEASSKVKNGRFCGEVLASICIYI
jgi:hypothetical protein